MRLRIVDPCSEQWSSMSLSSSSNGNERVRHCASCDRDVHDLSTMSDRAALGYALLHGRDGMCARLRVAQPPSRTFALALAPRSTLAAATLTAIVGCATSSPPPAATARDAAPIVIAPIMNVPTAAASSSVVVSEPAPTVEQAPPTEQQAPKVVVVVLGGMQPIMRVEFAHNAAKPTRESRRMIEDVAHALRDYPNIKRVRVIGSAATNERNPDALSLRRAQLVVEALVAQGIASERLEARGDGVTRPLDDNKTSRGRARNRNVSFEIVETPTPEACDVK